ncbi:MAG: enamine deaminase RidA [Actinobacteria bacterium]|nr:MAG: enamine deaminase RidA [Actinomycetota bacterium]
MTVRRINPSELAPPIGFTHVVVAEGTTMVLLAGQTAVNVEGEIVGKGIVEQFEQVMTNLLAALAAAGGAPSQLAKLTIYSVDPVDYREHAKEIGRIWHRLVGRDYPAMTLIGVTRLYDDAALLEIEGTAILP